MYDYTGSPAAFCDLVVSSFPDDVTSIESEDFELVHNKKSIKQYCLRNNCQLNVYERGDYTNKFIPRSVLDPGQDSSKALYFEIRGPISLAALLQVDRFLELYGSDSYFGAERDKYLEQKNAHQSVFLLQDSSRIALLCSLWSKMNFEDAETLQGILCKSLALNINPLLKWLNIVSERRKNCQSNPGVFYSVREK